MAVRFTAPAVSSSPSSTCRLSPLDRAERIRTPLRRTLSAWYRREARDLPWRRDPTPYRVWISEVMLQQTRVETVVGYFERFVAALPDVTALAEADPDRLLKLWEGLGYYGRVRNLQKAARLLVGTRGGALPDTAEALAALPGIGRYTAGAIASIAFGRCEPVLDGNVKRVLARILAVESSVDTTATTNVLWEAARVLVPRRAAGEFNQALMELGARVCVPRSPRCDDCPVRRYCAALALELQATLPVRTPRKPIPHYHIVAAAIRRGDSYLLGKRREDSMLGGLWEFPGGKVEAGETHPEALRRELREELDIEVEVGEFLHAVDHAYSHFSITLHLYVCRHLSGSPRPLAHAEVRWVPRGDFARLAFPAADLAFFRFL